MRPTPSGARSPSVMRNKAFILLLTLLCGAALYAQNINPGKSGGGTSSSSVSNIVNAAQVWTNDASIPAVVLNSPTNAILIGQGSSFIASGGFLEVVSPNREGAGGIPTVYMTHTLTASSGSSPVILSVNLAGDDSGVSSGDSGAIKINSQITGRKNGWFYGNGAAGLYSQAGSNTGSTNNSASAVVGYVYGREGRQAGVVGISDSKVSGYQVCPGVIGGSFGEGNVGSFLGGLFFVDAAGDFNEPTNFVSSCLTCENFSGNAALIITRTNNGTFHPFDVYGTKTTNATPLDVAGLVSAYNGVASLSTNATITVVNTGITNTTLRNYRLFGLTGISLLQTNTTRGVGFSRGTITTPLDITLQPGEFVAGSSVAVQDHMAF